MKRVKSTCRRRGGRGFSMIELAIVVSIVAIGAALAFPYVSAARKKSELNHAARQALGHIRMARGVGASGKMIEAAAPPVLPPGAHETFALYIPPALTVRVGGIRILSNTSYSIFGSSEADPANSQERDIEIVDLLAGNPNSALRIAEPPVGSEIRFHANGSVAGVLDGHGGRFTPNGTAQIILEDTETHLQKAISISSGGSSRIDY